MGWGRSGGRWGGRGAKGEAGRMSVYVAILETEHTVSFRSERAPHETRDVWPLPSSPLARARVAGAPREGGRPARGPRTWAAGRARCPPCATKVAQHAGIPPVSLSPRAELQKLRSPEAGGPGRRVETTGSSVGVLETLECTVQRGGRGPGGCRETVRILCGITITQKCTQGPDDQYTLQNG